MKKTLPSILIALFPLGTTALPTLDCQTQSSPNPIVNEYPGQITGTINGTYAIVPVPYVIARTVIPSQYGILKAAYEELIPGFPKDMFPAEFEGVLDHDVQQNGFPVADFQRIALHFPFVDRLNDGYSSFKYTAPQIISLNPTALLGALAYGETYLGTVDPPCDGYAGNSTYTYMIAHSAANSSLGCKAAFDTQFETADRIDYSHKLLVNVTNQPTFGSNLPVCDHYITLYNSSVTQGKFAPVPVKGTIKVVPPYYPVEATLTAQGFRMDNGFIETNYVPCESLKGYSGTGAGDTV